MSSQTSSAGKIELAIYRAEHCLTCDYTAEVADYIRDNFPNVDLRVIDVDAATEPLPEAVFATPTYLLNGRVWSLGNPSLEQVHEALAG